MIQFAVIADDLTGAADTAIQFCRVSAPVLMVSHQHLFSLDSGFACGALAVHTSSRHLFPAEAAALVRRTGLLISEQGPRVVYKKIDSCLRGNVGAEVESLINVLGYESAFVAPAFPAQGRSTLHDVHYIQGVPLALSEMARDRLNPVKSSRLSRLMAIQARCHIGRIDVACLESGSERMRAAVDDLLRQGCRIVTFDSTSQRHLEVIARLACEHFPKTLLTGSAGLARALVQNLPSKEEPQPQGPAILGRRLLFVCGSNSTVLRTQVEFLLRQDRIKRHVLRPGLQADVGRRHGKIGRDLADGAVVLQLAPPGTEGPGISSASADQAARELAAMAVTAMRLRRPDGLFISGGDTAAAVLDALGATGIWLHAEIQPGLVLGSLKGGGWEGLAAVIKAGAFGGPDTLSRIYDVLTGKEFLNE